MTNALEMLDDARQMAQREADAARFKRDQAAAEMAGALARVAHFTAALDALDDHELPSPDGTPPTVP